MCLSRPRAMKKKWRSFIFLTMFLVVASTYVFLMATVLKFTGGTHIINQLFEYKYLTLSEITGIYIPTTSTIPKNLKWNASYLVSSFLNEPCCHGFRKPNKKLNLKCNHCAFVSSSGHLLKSGAGREINRAQCIFRMNDSPTKGFEKDVGWRTTLRYLAPLGAEIVFRDPKPILSGPSQPKVLLFHRNNKTQMVQTREQFKKIDIYRYDQNNLTNQIFHNFGEKLNPTRNKLAFPSAGFKVITLALKMCNNVTVYGVSPPFYCRDVASKKVSDVLYHYYDAPTKDNTSVDGQTECFNFKLWDKWTDTHHDVGLEKLIYTVLMMGGVNLNFRFPQWNPQSHVYSNFNNKMMAGGVF